MSAMTPEGKVKKKVTAVLKEFGVWYFFPAANGYGSAGIPDIIAIVNGTFVGIEVKADPTKKPTPLQVRCGEQIQQAGGEWFLIRSDEDCEQLRAFLIPRRYIRAGD
jgi:hypothetical protein